MDLKFGFSMNPGDLGEVRDVGRAAEQAGYDRVGVWDSPALFHDPWVTLASLAEHTRRIRLGTWVTNPLTRHPVVTASAAASLDELAPGRVVLGIGTGDSGVYNLARSAAPLEALREYVEAVRGLLTEGVATWQGGTLRMRPARNPVPIWISAHGARSIRMAGRIGDGVVFGLGVSPEVVTESIAMLERGADEAGRDAAELERWFTAPWYVDRDRAEAREGALWHVASLAHHISRSGVVGKFIPERMAAGVLELGNAYDLMSHGDPSETLRAEYRALARSSGVADYLIDRFTISGTPEECAGRVLASAEAGAERHDCANDSPIGALGDRPYAWAADVMPLLTPYTERTLHV
ncbi:MAG: LLM class flavin-dependent oxidoreductase [Agromyces sp.]